MIKLVFSILCVIATVLLISSASANPQYQKSTGKGLENVELDHGDDLVDGVDKDDLKSSASYGYGYYGYPFGGFYSGYPSSYGLYGGYYGGYYPYYGGYGLHGHHF